MAFHHGGSRGGGSQMLYGTGQTKSTAVGGRTYNGGTLRSRFHTNQRGRTPRTLLGDAARQLEFGAVRLRVSPGRIPQEVGLLLILQKVDIALKVDILRRPPAGCDRVARSHIEFCQAR